MTHLWTELGGAIRCNFCKLPFDESVQYDECFMATQRAKPSTRSAVEDAINKSKDPNAKWES